MTKYEDMTMAQLRAMCAARGITPARGKAGTLTRLYAADAASESAAEQAPRPAPRGALYRMLMGFSSYGALCCQLPPVRAVLLPYKGGMNLHASQAQPYYPEGGRIALTKLRVHDARDRAAPPQGVEYF